MAVVSSSTSSEAARSAVGSPGAWEEDSADAGTLRLHLCVQAVASAIAVASVAASGEAVAASAVETGASEEGSTVVLAAVLVVVTVDSVALPTATAAVHPMRQADLALAGADTAAVLTVTAGTSEAAVGMADAVTTTGLAVGIAAVIDPVPAATLSPSVIVPDTVAVGIAIGATEVVIEVATEAATGATEAVTEATMTAATTPASAPTRAAQATKESERFADTNGEGTDASPRVGIFSPLISLSRPHTHLFPLRQRG